MLISRCCKEKVGVESDYFVCDSCGKPCDTLCVLIMENLFHDDERMCKEA
jgi:hypothetical protein